MKRTPVLPWVLLSVWGAWLYALIGFFASSAALGVWVPDLGLVLLLELDGKLSSARARWAAVVLAAARIAFTADPPLAVLAAYLGVVGTTGLLRGVIEVNRPFLRGITAGLAALACASFWALSRSLALGAAGTYAPPLDLPWQGAVSTAVVALLFLPLFGHLPGIKPLWRKAR